MSRVGDILAQALEHLRTDGWTTRVFEDEQGRMCATGAVNKALGLANIDCLGYQIGHYAGHPEREAAMTVLARFIPEEGRERFYSSWMSHQVVVASYNNRQTQFEVIEQWFEKAIAEEGTSHV